MVLLPTWQAKVTARPAPLQPTRPPGQQRCDTETHGGCHHKLSCFTMLGCPAPTE